MPSAMTVRDINDLPPNVHPRIIDLYRQPFLKQGTDEWLEQRYNFLTASDVAAVLGNCIFKKRADVLADKLRQTVPQPPTEAMKHGTNTEPEARAVYEKLTGKKVG